VRFIVGGETNPLATPDDGIDAVTVETVAKTTPKQGLLVSPSAQVSPVTQPDFDQVDPNTDGGTQLLNQAQLQRWLDRVAAVCDAHECMSCEDAINSLPSPVVEQIWGAASELLPRFWQVAEDELAIESTQVVKPQTDNSITNAQVQAATSEIGEQIDSFNISGQANEALCSSSPQQFTNSNPQTLANTCNGAFAGITNSTPIAPTELQQSPTKQELAALLLQCQSWVELVQFVGDQGELLKAAATTMAPQGRRSLVCLLVAHLCQNPTYLDQLAWVPAKLRQRALERLQFTIRQIRGVASSVLDAYVEYVTGCKFVSISYIGTAYEKWVFQTPDGATVPVEVDAVEAISCNQM
jgi:hypothetical protein